MTTLVVLQPGYLPWLGFFDQIRRADVFVYYDDVQFEKGGWRNRNRVKSPQGAVWLTVPVLQHGRGPQMINEVRIDNRRPWAHKHVETIRQLYAKAPFVGRYLPELEDLLERGWDLLAELDIAVTELMCGWLDLPAKRCRASELGIGGGQSERLINLCRHFGANHYLSGNAAQDYLDTDLFGAAGIGVEWQNYNHPEYPQLHSDFMPFLSALDLILNVGEDSLAVIAEGGPQEARP